MISQDTIDAVRNQVSIVSVVGERLRLDRRGRALVGLCPFHKEKTPSFNVSPEKGFYYCYGCGESGNVITFVQKLDGLTFPEAVRSLAEGAGLEVRETGSDADMRREAEARRRRDELYGASEAAADYFRRCLREHPLAASARDELARRGLAAESDDGVAKVLEAFRVGYAPHGWEGLVQHLRGAGVSLAAAETVGLVAQRKSGGYYDRFRHRLVFAVLDVRGRVIAFSGRSLPEPEGEAERDPAERVAKYYNSPESPIYRKREAVFGLFQAREAIRERNRAVVVEGNFDVVSLHARGLCHVVAPLGTAFTEQQAKELKRYTRNVTFLFDGDDAGRRATGAAREPCQAEELLPRVARLPQGVDPDDLVRAQGAEAVERVLAGAQPLLEYLIDTALESGFTVDDARARASKLQEVGALIAAEQDPTVRAMSERYADEVAGRLGVVHGQDVRSFRALQRRVVAASRGPQPGAEAAAEQRRPSAPHRARSRTRVAGILQQVLGAALEFPELLADVEVLPLLVHVEGDLAVALTRVAATSASTEEAPTPETYAERFPAALRPAVARRLVNPQLDDVQQAKAVLMDNLQKLERLQQRRERAGVVEELRRAAQAGDVDGEMSLLRRELARARARHGLPGEG